MVRVVVKYVGKKVLKPIAYLPDTLDKYICDSL